MLNINLDDYESIFDAVNVALNNDRGVMNRHTLEDVIDFPITDKSYQFRVQDLKQKTEDIGEDGIAYIHVSKESEDKNRVLKIDRYAGVYARYTTVNLDDEGNEIKDTRNRLYDFSVKDEPDYLQMYIEVLYEIKHY